LQLNRIFLCLLSTSLFLISCQEDKQASTQSQTSVVKKDMTTISKKVGCNSSTKSCTDIKVTLPILDGFSEETRKEIHALLIDNVSDFLVTEKPIKAKELGSYIAETVDAIVESNNESFSRSDLKYHSDFFVLFNNDELLCLKNNYDFAKAGEMITGESYFMIDLNENHLLYVDEMIQNFDRIESLLLQKVKEQNNVPSTTNIKELGFLVEDRDFAITDNIGITSDKIIFAYQPQEIAPNSSGLFRFILDKEEIKNDLTPSFVKKWESQQ